MHDEETVTDGYDAEEVEKELWPILSEELAKEFEEELMDLGIRF